MSALRSSFNATSVLTDSLRFRDLSGGILALTDKGVAYITPQFDSSGNVFPLLPLIASLPQLIAEYNRLISLFANNNIFLSLSQPILYFQTSCNIIFSTYNSSGSKNINVSIATETTSIEGLIQSLNSSFLSNNIPLSFTFNSNIVSLTAATDISFNYTDDVHYGEAQRFMNHLGLNALLPNYTGYPPYHTYIGTTAGSVIASGRGSEIPIPSAPAAPNVTGVFSTQIDISLNPASFPIKFIGIYVANGDAGFVSWDIVPATSTSYIISSLSRNTQYSIALTYLSDYDESPLSAPVIETTIDLFGETVDILNDANTTYTPVSPSEFIPWSTPTSICRTDAVIWSSTLYNLITVDQIDHIELSYYSGLSKYTFLPYDQTNDADVQLFFSRNTDLTHAQIIFNAGFNRVIPQGPDAQRSAVGSGQGPSLQPNTSITLAYRGNEPLFKAMFGGGSNTIIRTSEIQFIWLCNWTETYLNNCQLNAFTIYYNV